ncbi:hypothetical protein BC828DRAFT_391743 [Blastocladiella britannica]|nr:hypothetical protein BC828DRAFT_391743 [Blastocladiella britannica]
MKRSRAAVAGPGPAQSNRHGRAPVLVRTGHTAAKTAAKTETNNDTTWKDLHSLHAQVHALQAQLLEAQHEQETQEHLTHTALLQTQALEAVTDAVASAVAAMRDATATASQSAWAARAAHTRHGPLEPCPACIEGQVQLQSLLQLAETAAEMASGGSVDPGLRSALAATSMAVARGVLPDRLARALLDALPATDDHGLVDQLYHPTSVADAGILDRALLSHVALTEELRAAQAEQAQLRAECAALVARSLPEAVAAADRAAQVEMVAALQRELDHHHRANMDAASDDTNDAEAAVADLGALLAAARATADAHDALGRALPGLVADSAARAQAASARVTAVPDVAAAAAAAVTHIARMAPAPAPLGSIQYATDSGIPDPRPNKDHAEPSERVAAANGDLLVFADTRVSRLLAAAHDATATAVRTQLETGAVGAAARAAVVAATADPTDDWSRALAAAANNSDPVAAADGMAAAVAARSRWHDRVLEFARAASVRADQAAETSGRVSDGAARVEQALHEEADLVDGRGWAAALGLEDEIRRHVRAELR